MINANMPKLTDRQQLVYDFLEKYSVANGYMPSRLEIANELNIAPNGVTEHLKLIEKKKWITVIPKISRGIILHSNNSN